MPAQLLDGKKVAEKIKIGLREEISLLTTQAGMVPTLHAIQVGENQASELYLKSQRNLAELLGAKHETTLLPTSASPKDLIGEIERANRDPKVHGIIIQMPLPASFQVDQILDLISPEKDIEAVTTRNLGRLGMNKTGLAPCTAEASVRLIEEAGVDVFGKEAVIIGSSKVVGLPVFLLLVGKKMTSMICHTGTFKAGTLESHVRRADVLVVCAGKPNLIPGAWVKPGSIVIDVGINRVDGKTVGDIEFEPARERAGFITPVPGGVGPVTTVMLFQNLITAYKSQIKI